MKLNNFLTAKAIISLFFVIGFVLAPAPLLSLFGMTLDPAGIFAARLLGAMLIGIGLICWFEKNADVSALRSVILALLVADVLGFLVTLMGQLSGLTNALGWASVVLWFLLALGFGYFRFVAPDNS